MPVAKTAIRNRRAQADERLRVKAAQEDPSRFADLYEENFERVYAYVVSRVRNRDLAEDLTADVFHKALSALPNFDWRGVPFSAWLFRIAANVITDQWKRAIHESGDEPPEVADKVDLEETEHRARLFRLVDGLPPNQRQVLQMRFAEGWSIEEISRRMGRSEGAIKQLQFRAMARLRTLVSGGKRGAKHD